jgi:hypothetical protein
MNHNMAMDQLNSLYIEARYPGELGLLPNGKPGLSETEEFQPFAEDIYNRTKVIIYSESE